MSNKEIPDIGEMYDTWEAMKEVRSLLKACLYHPDMYDPEGWLRKAIDLIESLGKDNFNKEK